MFSRDCVEVERMRMGLRTPGMEARLGDLLAIDALGIRAVLGD